MEERVIQADFTDFKNIKSRSKMQLVFEVDISMAKHVLDVLGYPDNAKSIACAVSRLKLNETPAEEKPKSYAGQAKAMAQDVNFPEYANDKKGFTFATGSGGSEQYIKEYCGITSCSELVEGSAAVLKFKELRNSFNTWRNTPAPDGR